MQQDILKILDRAQGPEPYPVVMRWQALGNKLFRTDLWNIQRATSTLSLTEEVDFPDSYSANSFGVRRVASEAQHWLWEALVLEVPRLRYSPTVKGYSPPAKSEVRAVFEGGIGDPKRWGLSATDLVDLTRIVNTYCGSSYDPAEIAWRRAEAQRKRERWLCNIHWLRLSRMLANLQTRREQAVVDARSVTLGPFSIDPQALPSRCPCCQQPLAQLPPSVLPAARSSGADEVLEAPVRR
ncbi:hypothetical protein ACIA8O_38740 [Kitasatospora sp. NPDC051853]|uniref:hypothetical protein n=1 Tax=Kitasatospora sp. NPDC051853 TaxID=3364058 RepID=UPI0037B87326